MLLLTFTRDFSVHLQYKNIFQSNAEKSATFQVNSVYFLYSCSDTDILYTGYFSGTTSPSQFKYGRFP